MKYPLLFLLAILYAGTVCAQQYQCLQPGAKHYFINGNDYLRGVRIDSVDIAPGYTIYYPFHTKRGRYHTGSGVASLVPDGGSWLGKKVIRLADGTFLFDNVWGDTAVIRTQADVGDTWVFYDDTSDVYYMANVISRSEEMIYGVADTVKKIEIQAYRHSTSAVTADPANGLFISLSKSFGFYQAFDLYLFPHRRVSPYPGTGTGYDTVDYFFQKCDDQQFTHVDLYQPTWEEIYDFHVGDVFEYHEYCMEGTFAGACDKYILDTITGRVETPTQITYTIHEGEQKTILQFPVPVRTYSFTVKTKIITKGYAGMVDTSKMPEENGVMAISYYDVDDNSHCYASREYKSVGGTLFSEFEPCGTSRTYKLGLGMVAESICHDPSPGPESNESTQLIFCIKDGISCGTVVPVWVAAIAANTARVAVYPNPATEMLNLSFPHNKTYSFTLTTLAGQTVGAADCSGGEFAMSTAHLQSGVYILSIAGPDGERYVERVAILH